MVACSGKRHQQIWFPRRGEDAQMDRFLESASELMFIHASGGPEGCEREPLQGEER